MASQTQEPSGTWRIWWMCPFTRRQRNTRLLGVKSKKLADQAKTMIESLVETATLGQPPTPAAALWLAGLPELTHSRLAAAGLAEDRKKADTTNLDAYLRRFIETNKGRVLPSTAINYESARKFSTQYFGNDRSILSILPSDVVGFFTWLKESKKRKNQKTGKIETIPGLAENTARKKIAILRAMFEMAVVDEVLTKNPFGTKQVPRTVMPAAKERRLMIPANTINAVLAARSDKEINAALALGRWGGLRPSEIIRLTWDWVDWKDGTITIPCSKTKHQTGKDSRLLPLFPELRRVFLALKETATTGNPHLLPSYHGKTVQFLTYRVMTAVEEAGEKAWIDPWRNLRRTRATELVDLGYPQHVVNAWLGHCNAVADANYRMTHKDHFARATGEKDGAGTPVNTPAATLGWGPEEKPEYKAEYKGPKTGKNGGVQIRLEGIPEMSGNAVNARQLNEKTRLSAGLSSDPYGI